MCRAWRAISTCTAARSKIPKNSGARSRTAKIHWFEKWSQVLEWEAAVCEMVRRREDQRLLQLPRPSSRPRIARTKSRFCGKASPAISASITYQELHRLVVPLRQRAEIARLSGRRPRHHLHADDSGAAHRDAGVRAARDHPQRRVRRIFGGSAEGAHSGSGREPRDHRRWRLPARQRSEAQARRRRSAARMPRRARRDRVSAHRIGYADAGGPRPLVA